MRHSFCINSSNMKPKDRKINGRCPYLILNGRCPYFSYNNKWALSLFFLFFLVIGHLDDLVIVPGLVILALKFIPDDVVRKCRNKVNEEHEAI